MSNKNRIKGIQEWGSDCFGNVIYSFCGTVRVKYYRIVTAPARSDNQHNTVATGEIS